MDFIPAFQRDEEARDDAAGPTERGDSASGDLFVELGHTTAPRIKLPRSFDGRGRLIDAVEAKERARLQGIRTGGGREDLDEPLRPCERGRGLVLREPRLKPA